MSKQILTNSSLQAFKKCPRSYEYQYEKCITPAVESEALMFGKLFHNCLEEWVKNGKDMEKVISQLVMPEDIEGQYMMVKIISLLRGYDFKYHAEPYQYEYIEEQFTVPLLNPDTMAESKTFELSGKVDAIITDESGRFMIKETKTTSEDLSPESDYWRLLGMDTQVSGYYLGAESILGKKVETCLYDVIRKPTIRPKQVGKEIDAKDPKRTETPEEFGKRLMDDINSRPDFYFARKEIPRSESDLSDYLFDVWNIAQSLRSYQLKQKFPRYTSSCMGMYGPCKYFAACSGQTSIEDENYYKKSDVKHKELVA